MLPLYWIYLGCLICTAIFGVVGYREIKNIEENHTLNRVCFALMTVSAAMIFYGMLQMAP